MKKISSRVKKFDHKSFFKGYASFIVSILSSIFALNVLIRDLNNSLSAENRYLVWGTFIVIIICNFALSLIFYQNEVSANEELKEANEKHKKELEEQEDKLIKQKDTLENELRGEIQELHDIEVDKAEERGKNAQKIQNLENEVSELKNKINDRESIESDFIDREKMYVSYQSLISKKILSYVTKTQQILCQKSLDRDFKVTALFNCFDELSEFSKMMMGHYPIGNSNVDFNSSIFVSELNKDDFKPAWLDKNSLSFRRQKITQSPNLSTDPFFKRFFSDQNIDMVDGLLHRDISNAYMFCNDLNRIEEGYHKNKVFPFEFEKILSFKFQNENIDFVLVLDSKEYKFNTLSANILALYAKSCYILYSSFINPFNNE